MKKAILHILIALFAWLCVLFLCIRIGGDGLLLYFELPPGASGVEVRFDPESVVRLEESRVMEGEQELAVHLVPIQTGTTEATIAWEGLDANSLYAREIAMTIRSLPLGILTDSITWNFTGWEYMVICLTGFLLTLAVIMYLASRREQKKIFFSYRSIRLLGLAIFFFVISFFRTDYVVSFLRGQNSGTVWTLMVGIVSSAQTFVRWTAYVLGFFAVLTAASNLVLIRFEGFRPANMLGIAVAAFIIGGAILGIRLSYSRFIFPLRNILCNVYAALFVYFECLLAATVIRAAEAGRHVPDYDKDYVIVLGCKIRPDGTLYPLIRGRVDRAVAFVRAQQAETGKQAILVPSGGKGDDETLPEAEAMANYMAEQGIDQKHILVEDRSATTKENLRFSRALIGDDSSKVAFATSSYHVCRGGILAYEMGWNIDGIGSRTKWYFWPNAFLREFIGLLAESWVQQLTAAGVITVLSALLTLVM